MRFKVNPENPHPGYGEPAWHESAMKMARKRAMDRLAGSQSVLYAQAIRDLHAEIYAEISDAFRLPLILVGPTGNPIKKETP